MKIYVITAGSYSDYHICAVATDPVSAENLRLLYSDGWNGQASIETFDTEELPNRPKTCWSIGVSDDGLIFRCFERSILDDAYDFNGKEVDINQVTHGYEAYHVYVIADDEEHAKKIACDLIAQYKYKHEVERRGRKE